MSRSAAAILTLVFMVELTLFSILPIVPIYTDQLGLSKLQAGAILSASAFAVTSPRSPRASWPTASAPGGSR